MNNKMIKKATTVAVNSVIGALLAGGTGALIGIISSVDSGIISAGVDKIVLREDAGVPKEETKESVTGDAG